MISTVTDHVSGWAKGAVKRASTSLESGWLTVGDTGLCTLAAVGMPAARAVGAAPEAITAAVSGSPHLVDGRFVNAEPASGVDADPGVLLDMLRRPGRPRRPVPVTAPVFGEATGLAATWLGHASVLVEIDGAWVLTDPVFGRRCSPSGVVGPARLHPCPVSVADLPALDVVLISHDHYDHLDMTTVVKIAQRQPDTVFVVPLGVDAHLRAWGIAAGRIRRADLDETVVVGVGNRDELTFTCGPARHFSGRWLTRNHTRWASWAFGGPRHRVFFSGDTGHTEWFDDFGSRHGPFDLTLVAVGAYDRTWPDVHVTPEEALDVHRMVSGGGVGDSVLLPIHWGTFNLARHSWAEPIWRLLPAAADAGVTVVVPNPGGSVDLAGRTGTGLVDPAWWERSA